MNRISFRRGEDILTLPAPHPERAFTRDRDDNGAVVEKQWLRFLDLGDEEADALLAWQRDALAGGAAFVFADETGREWKVRAADGCRPVRQAPGNWEITVVLEHDGSGFTGDDDEANVWREGRTRFARGSSVVILPAPLPERDARQASVQAVGVAADGTRHVFDNGRVRHEITLRFAALTDAQRRSLADFHAAGAGGRDEFVLTEPDGGQSSWRFADGPLAFHRLAEDSWRVEPRLIREVGG